MQIPKPILRIEKISCCILKRKKTGWKIEFQILKPLWTQDEPTSGITHHTIDRKQMLCWECEV